MSFKIIKRGSGDFWHNYNDVKELNISEWTPILEAVGQTVVLEMPNGANYPQKAVGILDVIVIDETDASVEETFTNVEDLRVRLVALGYTPYLDESGLTPDIKDALFGANTPDASNPFATIADVAVVGGVQSVSGSIVDNTDPVNPEINGMATNNPEFTGGMYSNDGNAEMNFEASYISFQSNIDGSNGILGTDALEFNSGSTGDSHRTTSEGLEYVVSGGSDSTKIRYETPTGTGIINFPDVVDETKTVAMREMGFAKLTFNDLDGNPFIKVGYNPDTDETGFWYDNGVDPQVRLSFTPEGFVCFAPLGSVFGFENHNLGVSANGNPDFIGILGDVDFSANYTDFAFVQKIYVNSNFGKLISLTTTEILALDPIPEAKMYYNNTTNEVVFYNGSEWRQITSTTM